MEELKKFGFVLGGACLAFVALTVLVSVVPAKLSSDSSMEVFVGILMLAVVFSAALRCVMIFNGRKKK